MTKEQVLAAFEANKGEIVSGITLAEQLGITRTAIWKAINQLREEGYDIESVKKKGYRLNVNSDILSHVKIRANLDGDFYDIKLYKAVDSTNKVARQVDLEENKEWLVIASEMQEQGRGREETLFFSPSGKGIYMSIVLKPNCCLTKKEQILRMIGESVSEGIGVCTGIQVDVEMPGNIVYKGQKIGGILTEGQVELESELLSSIVIGIGIYIYDIESTDYRVSLSTLMGSYCNRSELIAALLNRLKVNYDELKIDFNERI